MNPIGMHYGFWSHNWDEIAYIPLMEKLAWLGFDICEVASAEWGYYDDARLRELKACADHNGLGITYSIGLEAKYDLASDDPAVRENGIRHVTRILESMPKVVPVDNKMKGKRLLSSADKHALIASLGVEYYLTPDFEEIKGLTPEQFVLGIIRDCNARALFCGENFTFGARAAGTPELLRQLCEPLGVEVVVLPMAQFEEKPVSSTRIRTALEGGDIPAANAMLGMPYAIRFTVHHGAGLGRTLGVPTINQLYPQGFQLPRYGIYITRTRIGDRWYPSATGLGTRPTVNSDESKVTCETFIPGFTGDLYGTDPVVEFHAYLSPSKKFDTLDELRECIDHAAQRAQEYFAE